MLRDRLANLAWSLLPAAPLGVARVLTPDASGMGTHRQLGLPPCTFLWVTGFPCPFCGMTTSWTHAAHGELGQAIQVQPMGFVFFVVALALLIANLVRVALDRPALHPERVLGGVPRAAWIAGAGGVLLAWGYKIALVRGWV